MLVNGDAAEQPGLIKDTTTQGFRQDVVAESMNQPVLVDFWAPWCGRARQLTPVIEKVVKEARGKVRLVKMNIDDFPEIPGQLGIQSDSRRDRLQAGPADRRLHGRAARKPGQGLHREACRADGAGATEELIAAAQAAAEAGDAAGASELYAGVLELEPENVRRDRGPGAAASRHG